MSRYGKSVKSILFGIFSCVLISACSILPFSANQKNLQEARESICIFDIPAGYTTQFVVAIGDNPMVSLMGKDGTSHIYLVQLPQGVEIDLTEMQEPLGIFQQNAHEEDRTLKVVGHTAATLRGEEVPVLISEGINSNGQPYREWTAVFTGNSGPAVVNISAPIQSWDQNLVDQFLASLR